MLKFSANLSLLFTEVPLLERFALAKRYGFNAVEIQFPYSLQAEAVQQELLAHDLKLVLFNVAADDLLQGGEGLACVPQKRLLFQHALEQALQYAYILKPDVINVLPGRCLESDHLQRYIDTFKDNVLLAVQAFAPLGIKTVFEAINTYDMPGFIIHSSEQMLQVLNELNQPTLAMQYDVYHMTKMGEAVASFISDYSDKIGHIQFADCPGRGQPGTGQIDFHAIFAAIAASRYTGWIGAEYKPVASTSDSLTWLSAI